MDSHSSDSRVHRVAAQLVEANESTVLEFLRREFWWAMGIWAVVSAYVPDGDCMYVGELDRYFGQKHFLDVSARRIPGWNYWAVIHDKTFMVQFRPSNELKRMILSGAHPSLLADLYRINPEYLPDWRQS